MTMRSWAAWLARFLLSTGPEVTPGLRRELIRSLYETLPIFSGGALSTIGAAAVMMMRLPQPKFILWFALEVVTGVMRLGLVAISRRAAALGFEPPSDGLVIIEVVAPMVVAFGIWICMTSGDPFAFLLAWMSAAALIGEACMRTLAAPRLVTVITLLGAVPCALGCLASAGQFMDVAALLTVLYAASMRIAAVRLNAILTTTMRAERENDHRARHDKLTGLLNRAGLEREMELLRLEYPDSNLTLFFLDLDGFKQVNDSEGHAAGDRVLRIVAEHLLAIAAPRDIVARVGGDEFVIVSALDMLRQSEFANAIIASIARASSKLVESTSISASVGIAQSDEFGENLGTLMGAADSALYKAKQSGGARFILAAATDDRVSHATIRRSNRTFPSRRKLDRSESDAI